MKTKRHAKILELIREYDVDTQEELCRLLNQSGFPVTQATVSRDIRELKLIKVSQSSGVQKYMSIQEQGKNAADRSVQMFRDSILSVDMAQNILVIHTASGMAMAVAASLDAMNWNEIVGTIAGDDTIMSAVRTVEETETLVKRLRKLLV